jgi:hypothetical protein
MKVLTSQDNKHRCPLVYLGRLVRKLTEGERDHYWDLCFEVLDKHYSSRGYSQFAALLFKGCNAQSNPETF